MSQQCNTKPTAAVTTVQSKREWFTSGQCSIALRLQSFRQSVKNTDRMLEADIPFFFLLSVSQELTRTHKYHCMAFTNIHFLVKKYMEENI